MEKKKTAKKKKGARKVKKAKKFKERSEKGKKNKEPKKESQEIQIFGEKKANDPFNIRTIWLCSISFEVSTLSEWMFSECPSMNDRFRQETNQWLRSTQELVSVCV